MSLGRIFNTSISGLNAARVGISVTSNNISNVNTKGYTRQIAHFASNQPSYVGNKIYLGSGVQVTNIERIKDMYLEDQIRNQTSDIKSNEQLSNILGSLEMYFNEPSETGFNAAMSDLFNAWDKLANNPSDPTLKVIVAEKAQTLAEKFNNGLQQIGKLETAVSDMQTAEVNKLDQLVGDLNKVNDKISQLFKENKAVSNELLDERDRLLAGMSEITGINAKINADNTVDVTVDLGPGAPASPIQLTNPATGTAADVKDFAKSGSLKGLNDASKQLTDFKNNLNTLVKGVADQVNSIYNASGTGDNFFVYDPANPAGTIAVNPGIMDGSIPVVPGDPAIAGDGSIAKKIAQLRDKDVFGDKSLQEFYKEMVVTVGSNKNAVDTDLKNQNTLLKQLVNKRDSLSAVSMDEETANLVMFQSAYEANAKVVQVVTEMFDTLIGMMR